MARDSRISVLTRNLYLGTDLTPLSEVSAPADVPVVGAQLWGEILASDFPSRAKVLAEQIIALAPDLVALQEVTLYRRQVPSDAATGNTTPNAEEVVLDFLASLMAELDARGSGYTVAGVATNADARAPGRRGRGSLRPAGDRPRRHPGPGRRRDLELRAADVQRRAPAQCRRRARHVQARLQPRRRDGGRGAFHLRQHPPRDRARAPHSVRAGVGAGRRLQPDRRTAVLVGDYNSSPSKPTYDNILDPAFTDPQPAVAPGNPGLTCCQAADLMNPTSIADERIDLTLYRGRSARPASRWSAPTRRPIARPRASGVGPLRRPHEARARAVSERRSELASTERLPRRSTRVDEDGSSLSRLI